MVIPSSHYHPILIPSSHHPINLPWLSHGYPIFIPWLSPRPRPLSATLHPFAARRWRVAVPDRSDSPPDRSKAGAVEVLGNAGKIVGKSYGVSENAGKYHRNPKDVVKMLGKYHGNTTKISWKSHFTWSNNHHVPHENGHPLDAMMWIDLFF